MRCKVWMYDCETEADAGEYTAPTVLDAVQQWANDAQYHPGLEPYAYNGIAIRCDGQEYVTMVTMAPAISAIFRSKCPYCGKEELLRDGEGACSGCGEPCVFCVDTESNEAAQ